MTWVIAGLFYGLLMSFYTYINQNNKINGYVLGIWRGFGVAFISLPLIFMTPFEWDLPFFAVLIIQGIMIGYYDSSIFFSSARYGAAGTSRILVFSILISMFLWWATHPAEFLSVWQNKPAFIGILLSVAGIVCSYITMIKTPLTKQLIRYMMPTVVIWSLMSTLNQWIMQKHNLYEGLIYYLFYATLVSGFYNLYFYIKTVKPTKKQAIHEIFTFKVRHIGVIITLFSSLLIVSKSIALNAAPNTGYVNALSLTSPLWIMLYNHLLRHKDDTSPKAGIMMLICLLFLTIFANL